MAWIDLPGPPGGEVASEGYLFEYAVQIGYCQQSRVVGQVEVLGRDARLPGPEFHSKPTVQHFPDWGEHVAVSSDGDKMGSLILLLDIRVIRGQSAKPGSFGA